MNRGTSKDFISDPPDYMRSIKEKKDFYIQFHHFTKDVEAVITKIIHRYLEEYDIIYMKNPLLAVTKELINNSIKANIKRLYFKLQDLDINKIEDYRRGMETFKSDTFQQENSDIYEKLKQSKLVVRTSFKTSKDFIHISVINNIPILDTELKKVNARITKAYKYNDITEAFEDVIDDSEGAGLGLIMAMMLLKNAGLPPESFKIYRKDDLTIATLSIPQIMSPPESTREIADAILKEIDELPAFPENIKNIQKLCSTPDASIKEIADNISLDPGLTFSILKLANSAGYVTSKKVDTIEEAVKIIGMKGINTLLLASGVTSIIDSKYKKYEALWKESYKRAFYAQKLSIQLKHEKISDFAYLAGLLADVGRIVLLSIDPDLINRLKNIAGFKGIDDPHLIEEISLGLSHSSLGGIIAKKWNLNNALVKAIEYHHRPYMSPKNLRQLNYIIYLADIFIEIENKKSRFEVIDEDVLDFFNLNDKSTFEMLHRVLQESYKERI